MKDLGFSVPSLNIEIPVRLHSGKVVTFNIKDELYASEETLSEDFMEQAGKYAWWAMLAETAKHYRDSKELELDKAEARADKEAREELEVSGTKITEGAVKSLIKLNEGYIEAYQTFNESKKNAAILEKVAKAFEQRKDMLQSAGKAILHNKEYSSEIRGVDGMKNRAEQIMNRNKNDM